MKKLLIDTHFILRLSKFKFTLILELFKKYDICIPTVVLREIVNISKTNLALLGQYVKKKYFKIIETSNKYQYFDDYVKELDPSQYAILSLDKKLTKALAKRGFEILKMSHNKRIISI